MTCLTFYDHETFCAGLSGISLPINQLVCTLNVYPCSSEVPGGVDFSSATRTEDGRLCVIKEDEIETLSKDPVLDCTHKEVTE